MNEWKVVAAAIRPYLRRKGDDEFVAEQVMRGLAAAGFTLVEIPSPSDIGPYGPVWETGDRYTNIPLGEYGGPVGTVQYRPEIRRIEVRDDYEHDYLPAAVWADAAALIAACCFAAKDAGPQKELAE